MMESNYNVKSPAVRRIMKEAAELSNSSELFFAQPLDDNLFEWHFTVRGPPDTEFDAGIYHGRISLPPDYPMKPPSIIILTPNGRFELNKKICLSISGHHPESWQPSWSIRTALLALIGFMPTHGAGAIGSLDYTPDERKLLAKKSQEWKCDVCKKRMKEIFPPLTEEHKRKLEESSKEARELAQQISFKDEHDSQVRKNLSTDSLNSTNSESDREVAAAIKASIFERARAEQQRSSPLSRPDGPSSAGIGGTGSSGWNTTPTSAQFDDDRQQADGSFYQTANLVMILLVSVMIAALVLRRIYIMTEWRFYGSNAPGGGPPNAGEL